jgi:integrase/recombinase XerD
MPYQKIPDYLQKDEVKEILNVAKIYSKRDYTLFSFMWNTGARVSEAISVTPGDIEFHRMFVIIRHAKGGKQRRLPLDEKITSLLSEYIAENNIGKNERIWPIAQQTAGLRLRLYGAMVGIKTHPHMLRHSFAIHLVRSGVDLRRVQILMGHSDLSTTAIYLQFDDEDIRQAMDKVSFT